MIIHSKILFFSSFSTIVIKYIHYFKNKTIQRVQYFTDYVMFLHKTHKYNTKISCTLQNYKIIIL